MEKSNRRQAKSDLFENANTAQNSITLLSFKSTNNLRHLRVIHALGVRPMTREQLDHIAGRSNGPALIADMCDLGIGKSSLLCTMVPNRDRDSCAVHRGLYSFSEVGHRANNVWLRERKGGQVSPIWGAVPVVTPDFGLPALVLLSGIKRGA